MLDPNSTSSIQKRRQQHRRQQSLEAPLLATLIPANQRRTPGRQGQHRRGLSLDQSLRALHSPSGTQSFPLPQDHDEPVGPSPVRIHLDTTNLGQPTNPQHFVQDTQQHIPAQPGYLAQDFQSHLQQQLSGNVNPHIAAPTPTNPNQRQALQDLQKHLEWYQQNFGPSPDPNSQTVPLYPNSSLSNQLPLNHPASVQATPRTPVSQGQSRTVPNTPQRDGLSFPSPPPSHAKHARSQSFQLDVAPMPTSLDAVAGLKMHSSPYTQPLASFPQESFTIGPDNSYASSAYSTSIVDPMSPRGQTVTGPMPTLFEEPTPPLGLHSAHGELTDDALLLQAAAGASDDFNSPNFMIGGMSPHTAMLHNLGEGVNASIIDTGVNPDQVEEFISAQHPGTKLWYCLYSDEKGSICNKDFKRKENAFSHVQMHLDDRQYKCNDCHKTFVRQHDMKRHAKIHSDDRPFVCPCGGGFARHDALTRHRQRGMCVGALPGFEKKEEDKPKRGRPKKKRPDEEARSNRASKARKMDRDYEADAARHIAYASSSSGASYRSLPMTPPDNSDFDADAFINMAHVDVQHLDAASSWRDTPPTSPVSAGSMKIIPGEGFRWTEPAAAINGISPGLLTDRSSPSATAGATSSPSKPSMTKSTGSSSIHNTTTTDAFTGGSSPLSGHGENFCDLPNFGAIEAQPDIANQDLFSDAFSPSYGYCTDASSPFSSHDACGSQFDEFMMNAKTVHTHSDDFIAVQTQQDVGARLSLILDDWLTQN